MYLSPLYFTGDDDGFYYYMDTSSGSRGDKATLTHQFKAGVTGFNGLCIKFAYHMYGSTIGTLRVGYRVPFYTAPTTFVWSKSGNQGNQWRQIEIPISKHSISSNVHVSCIYCLNKMSFLFSAFRRMSNTFPFVTSFSS